MDLILCAWGLLTLVAEGVRCQGVYGECGDADAIVTLCRRWPLVICSESRSGGCRARARARAPRTLRDTGSHEGSGRRACGSLGGSGADQIILLRGSRRRVSDADYDEDKRVAVVPRTAARCCHVPLPASLSPPLPLCPSLTHSACTFSHPSLVQPVAPMAPQVRRRPRNDRCAPTARSTPAPCPDLRAATAAPNKAEVVRRDCEVELGEEMASFKRPAAAAAAERRRRHDRSSHGAVSRCTEMINGGVARRLWRDRSCAACARIIRQHLLQIRHAPALHPPLARSGLQSLDVDSSCPESPRGLLVGRRRLQKSPLIP